MRIIIIFQKYFINSLSVEELLQRKLLLSVHLYQVIKNRYTCHVKSQKILGQLDSYQLSHSYRKVLHHSRISSTSANIAFIGRTIPKTPSLEPYHPQIWNFKDLNVHNVRPAFAACVELSIHVYWNCDRLRGVFFPVAVGQNWIVTYQRWPNHIFVDSGVLVVMNHPM